MIVWDLDNIPHQEILDTVDQCNKLTDAVLATGEPWDDWMKRNAPPADVIIACWRNPETKRGFEIGVLKGEGKLTLMSQGRDNQKFTVRVIHCRLFNRAVAWGTAALYGDDRKENEEHRHLLAETMSKLSRRR